MEVLELVLRRDGTVKSFKSDFKIYRGSYGDVLFNMSVPHELLVDQVHDIDTNDIITGNYVAVSAVIRTVVGKNLQTKKYYFKAVKDYELHGTTHRLYQRKLPKEFTLWETVNQHEAIGGGLLEMIVNVVNFTTDDEKSRIEEVVASPILTLDIYPSDKLDEEEEMEPSEFEALHSQVEDLQMDYTTTHDKAEEALLKAVSADVKSDEAISTANTAKNIAEGIDSKAEQALTNSANAVDTSNTALDLVSIADNKAQAALDGLDSATVDIATAQTTADDAYNIAIGASRSIALNDEVELFEFISNIANKDKLSVGDAIYLKQLDYPDYWVSEKLETPNASGYYYEIEPMESKLPDITNMVTTDTNQTIIGNKNHKGSLKKNNIEVATVDDIIALQSGKVDKVADKGLSTNDYDNTEKQKVSDNTAARHTHSNKTVLDNTTASFTTAEKTKLQNALVYSQQTLTPQQQQQAKQNLNIIETTLDIQQTIGQSTTAVMSQKAVTDAIQTAIYDSWGGSY